MADLDKDVLKKTAGLLADIDRALAAPTVAERVARVIESAAPDRRYSYFDTIEAWEWHSDGQDASGITDEEFEAFWEATHRPDGCDCKWLKVTISGIDQNTGEPYSYDTTMRECDNVQKEDIFHWVRAPYHFGGSTHAAKDPCGAEGCACEEVFRPKEKPMDWSIWKGAVATYEVYDEVAHLGRMPVFDEQVRNTYWRAVVEEHIRVQYNTRSEMNRLLDIDICD